MLKLHLRFKQGAGNRTVCFSCSCKSQRLAASRVRTSTTTEPEVFLKTSMVMQQDGKRPKRAAAGLLSADEPAHALVTGAAETTGDFLVSFLLCLLQEHAVIEFHKGGIVIH